MSKECIRRLSALLDSARHQATSSRSHASWRVGWNLTSNSQGAVDKTWPLPGQDVSCADQWSFSRAAKNTLREARDCKIASHPHCSTALMAASRNVDDVFNSPSEQLFCKCLSASTTLDPTQAVQFLRDQTGLGPDLPDDESDKVGLSIAALHCNELHRRQKRSFHRHQVRVMGCWA